MLQTSLMTQGTHLQNDSLSLHIDWIYIYICTGMVHFKVNLIFLIKIAELIMRISSIFVQISPKKRQTSHGIAPIMLTTDKHKVSYNWKVFININNYLFWLCFIDQSHGTLCVTKTISP